MDDMKVMSEADIVIYRYRQSCDTDMLTMIAEVERLRAALSRLERGGWISVKDRLPKPMSYILVAASSGEVKKCFYEPPEFFVDCSMDKTMRGCGYIVTHWMPLPAAPKEEP